MPQFEKTRNTKTAEQITFETSEGTPDRRKCPQRNPLQTYEQAKKPG